jgi:hypothetical protein
LSDAIGIFAAAVRQACFALPSAVLTFALLVVIRLQAWPAVDRALEFWIFSVASRHLCLAAATPLPEPAVVDVVVDVEDDVEVLELPHALRAAAATTVTTRSAERRSIMPPSSRKASRSWSSGPVGRAEAPTDNI